MALTKLQVQMARAEINKALATIAAKTGMDFTIGNIRFDATGMRTKLVGTVRGAAGLPQNVVADPKAVALRQKAYLLGNNVDLTKSYHSTSLGVFKFTGFNTRGKKYPFFVKTASGKGYKITTAQAKAYVANGPVA
jgi:hypothetical protein